MRAFWIVCTFVGAATAAPDVKPEAYKPKVAGDRREALIYAPTAKSKDAAPVVFVFHGHGGTAAKAAEQFAIHTHWHHAVVVYMQGLPTVSTTDPKGIHPGWQHEPEQADDRDLKFFDHTFEHVKKAHKIDEKRVYATGQSNGGGFVYLLWATRGDKVAAVAPSSEAIGLRFLKELKANPKPVLHFAGRKDTIAPFDKQRKLLDALHTSNGCEDKGQTWHKFGTLFPSKTDTPVVEVIHDGGHELFAGAPELIVAFFKEYPKK